LAEKQNCDLPGLKLPDMQKIEPRVTKDVYKVLTAEASVNSRTSFGGTAPSNVAREAKRWLKLLR
jgi:argininosuccinate lyase